MVSKGPAPNRRLNILLGLVVFLLVFTVAAMVLLNMNIMDLSRELNQTKGELSQLEIRLEQQGLETQSQIGKIEMNIVGVQADLEGQFAELKASASADFSGIIEDAVKSVVSIKTDVAQGSGFIISEEGYVVTNTHVLNRATYAKALTSDGNLRDASLIGYDAEMDVAVLKISGSFDSIEFGNSDDVRVGEKAIAIGNPLGLSFSVSEGIVSALNREGPNGKKVYIQIDVPLNPGNSGGPLVNKKGKVIGINNFKAGDSEGLGFALESNAAVQVINSISMQALNVTIV